MLRKRRFSSSGFTLVETLLVVVALAVVASLTVPRIWKQIRWGYKAEAYRSLGAIRKAQLDYHQLSNQFVKAMEYSEMEKLLGLKLRDGFYKYSIVEADENDFLALATPLKPFEPFIDEIGIKKDGFVESQGKGSSGTEEGGVGGGGGSGGKGGGGGGSSGGSSSGGFVGGVSTGGGSGSFDIVTEVITLSSPLETSAAFDNPQGLQLIANDGWVTLGWIKEASAQGYRVWKATKTANPDDLDFQLADSFFESAIFGDSAWEVEVPNGEENCYRVTAVLNNIESPPSSYQCIAASNASDFAVKAQNAKDILSDTVTAITDVDGVTKGDDIVQFLQANGIPLLFGTGPNRNNALAYQNPVTHTIVFDVAYKNAADEIVAAILAHEGIHSIWGQDYDDYQDGIQPAPVLGMPIPGGGIRSSNSIDQEYRAFLSAAQIWKEIKGAIVDADLDFWTDTVLNNDGSLVDEDVAKAVVKQAYTSLNDY